MSADNRKTQLEVGVNATPAKQGLAEIGHAAQGMAQALAQSAEQGARGVDKVASSADGVAQKLERAEKSIISSIQRRTAAFQAAEKGASGYFESLAEARGVDPAKLKPYLDQLRQVEVAQKAASGTLGGMGTSAAQTAAALRQIPAQFSDIVTSLQGGQAPLTVLLQQGGQIKDSFGGAGAAAKALGTYVMGLINPFTVAAAAGGALALAYFKGAHEGEAFNRTLILSGNVAGVTGGQLADAAAGMVKFGITQSAAVEVLNQLAAAGISGETSLRRFGMAALELERVGGPAASETAKAFADLAKAPLEASLKLNDATHYLTRSMVEQIDALEKQGRHMDAAQLAMTAYADAINTRTPALLNNLGLIERAWLGIKSAGAGLVDSVASIGRPVGPEDKLKELQKRLAEREKANQNAYGRPDDAATDGLRQQIQMLSKRVLLQQEAAAAEGEAARQVEAAAKWGKEQDAILPNRLKMAREIAAAQSEGAAAGARQEEVEARIAAIRQRYDTGANIEQIKQAELAHTEEIKRGVESINTLRALGHINEQTAIEETTRLDLDAIAARRSAVAGELAIVSKRQNSEREALALSGQLAQLAAEAETRRLVGVNAVTVAIEKQRKAILLELEAQRQVTQNEIDDYYVRESKAREAGRLAVDDYVRSIQEQNEQTNFELGLVGRTQQARDVAIEQYKIQLELKRQLRAIDENSGFDEAQREVERARARAAAAQASAGAVNRAYLGEVQRTADQIEQQLTDALMRGFESGKGFAENLRDTVVNMFKTMVLRPIVQAVVSPISGGIQSLLGAPGGSSSSGAQWISALGGAASQAGAGWGTLGVANGVGAAGGDGLGALIAGNASRWGVSAAGVSGSAGAAGGAMSSAAAMGPYAAAIVAGMMASNSAYDQGFNETNLPWTRAWLSTGGIAPPTLKWDTQMLQKIGLSQKAANIITGASLWSAAFGNAAPRADGGGIRGSFAGGAAQGQTYTDWTSKGGWFSSDKHGTNYGALGDDVSGVLNSGAKAMLEQTKQWAQVLKLPADVLAGVTSTFKVKLTGDAEQDKAAIAGILDDYQAAMTSKFSSALTPFQKTGEKLTETLKRLSGVQQFTDDINSLGGLFSRIAGASVGAKEGLAAMVGGFDELTKQAKGFVSNYYSRDEIAGVQAAGAQKTLADVGITADISATDPRAQFRALVEGSDVNTEAGRKRLAALLGMQDQFAGLADYLQESGKSLSQAASGAPSISVLGPLLSNGTAQQVQATNSVKDAIDSMHDTLQKLYERMGVSGGQVGGLQLNRWREVGIAP